MSPIEPLLPETAPLPGADYFDAFAARLADEGRAALHAGEIGHGRMIPGPFGAVPLLYADYTASGRALRQVETAMQEDFLPFYANSHTEASFCGGMMTRARRAARDYIARQIGAGPEHAVIFTGSGATAGLNRLVHLFGIPQALATGRAVRVLNGPYEHHSNILPWRESGAEVITIPEAPAGGPDMAALDAALTSAPEGALLIGAFSAGSNVTGVLADVPAVSALLKRHGALAVWDYAAAGPYVPISMTPGGIAIDAIAVSPHKFTGGPGASGLLVLRRDACASTTPTFPGGGTVAFVSPQGHRYSQDIVAREEAGTPNVPGDLRAALAFAVKAAIGADFTAERLADLAARGDAALRAAPGIELLATPQGAAHLPIFSFRLRDPSGALIHHQYATRLLSDAFGIQARGGCACAGPYVHQLLDIDEAASSALDARLIAGEEMAKPGFVRLNLSALHTDAEVTRILEAIAALPALALAHAGEYCCDTSRAIFRPAELRVAS